MNTLLVVVTKVDPDDIAFFAELHLHFYSSVLEGKGMLHHGRMNRIGMLLYQEATVSKPDLLVSLRV